MDACVGALLIGLGWAWQALLALGRLTLQVGGGFAAIYIALYTAIADAAFVALAVAIFAVTVSQFVIGLPRWTVKLCTWAGVVLPPVAVLCWLFDSGRVFTTEWAFWSMLAIIAMAAVFTAIICAKLDSDDRPQYIATHVPLD